MPVILQGEQLETNTAKVDAGLKPLISILIPCRNEEGHIGACLTSVLKFSEPDGGFEVLIVDGESDDRTCEIVRAFAQKDERVRLLRNPKRTVPHAMNLGIRAARGQYIARLDAHAKYSRDYLTQCLQVMQQTRASNVGGPWRADGHDRTQRAVAAAFGSAFAVGNSQCHYEDYEGYVHSVYPGFYKRQTLLNIGLYDEELVRNQDDELNLRLQLAGGTIYQSPKIKLTYYPRASIRQLFKQYLQYGYWKVRVIQKHCSLSSWRHVIPALFVLGLASGPVLLLTSPFLMKLWLVIVALYLLFSLWASARLAAKKGRDIFVLLPFIFLTYHVSYGLGFLQGLWDFVFFKKHRKGKIMELYMQLTR